MVESNLDEINRDMGVGAGTSMDLSGGVSYGGYGFYDADGVHP